MPRSNISTSRTDAGNRTTAGNRQFVRNFVTCIKFSTNNDLVDLTTPLALTGVFSFFIWFKREDGGNNWLIGSSSGTAKIGLFGGIDNAQLFVRLINGGSSATADIGYRAGLDNKWNFLCVTRDASNVVTASLNGGAFVTIGTLSGTTTLNRVGRDNATDSFQGLMDDIIFAPSVSTLAMVQDAYYKGIYPDVKTLFYEFNEGSGTTANDSSGNGNTGSITGATYSTNVFIIPRSNS